MRSVVFNLQIACNSQFAQSRKHTHTHTPTTQPQLFPIEVSIHKQIGAYT